MVNSMNQWKAWPRDARVDRRRARWMASLIVVLPILSMLAGAALSAHRHGMF